MTKEAIVPNTFLIGAQKSATTSFYNWIAQHPDICGPESIKDVGFFLDDRLYNKGLSFLSKAYKSHYNQQKIILHSNVNYIYFEEALKKIHSLGSDTKFVLILRNPVERAISAYYFFKQRGLEEREMTQAFMEEETLKDSGSLQELCDFTYKEHGLYAKQINQFYKYFDKDKLLVLFFEDLKNEPFKELSKAFKFLGIDDSFKPNLNHENKTGVPSSKVVQKLIHGENRIKKALVHNVLDMLVSLETKNKIKKSIGERFMKESNSMKKDTPENFKKELYSYYMSEIENLEELLQRDLSEWKKY